MNGMKAGALFVAVAAAVASAITPTNGALAEVDDLVAQLSWKSVEYDHIAMTRFPKASGSVAERLVAIGGPATPALLAALSDSQRAAAAQLVLCRIWFPGELVSGEEPLYRNEEVIGFRYHVRGLVWTVPDSGEPVTDMESVNAALAAWCRRVPRSLAGESCKRAG